MAKPKPVNEVMPAAYVGRLATVTDRPREIGRAAAYRAMPRGELQTTEGTRLSYLANMGVQLAEIQDELRAMEASLYNALPK